MNLKELSESPALRIANFFLMVTISLIGTILLRAESQVKTDIQENERDIELLETRVDNLEQSATANTVTLEYIKETLTLIREDIKDIKNK